MLSLDLNEDNTFYNISKKIEKKGLSICLGFSMIYNNQLFLKISVKDKFVGTVSKNKYNINRII